MKLEVTGKARFRQALVLTLCIWFLFVYGAYCASELIAGRTDFLREVPLDLPVVLLVALFAQTLYPLAVATSAWPLPRRLAAIVAGVVAVSFCQSLVNLAENSLLSVMPSIDAAHVPMIRAQFGRNFLSHVYVTLANAALLMILVEAQKTADQRLLIVRSEAAASEARALALRLQLNPHFLFNALNSISSLIVTRRVDDAEEMIGRLSDFLRQSLQSDPSGVVALEEEFAAIETYLEIEAVRFGDRMSVGMECPPDCAKVEVPSFILQPLVENAVKYGVARSKTPVAITVSARCEVDRIVVRVTDDAQPDEEVRPQRGLGIGMDNIAQRLAARYGERATLRVEPGAPGYVATVIVPSGAA
jgi:hypothetical protein